MKLSNKIIYTIISSTAITVFLLVFYLAFRSVNLHQETVHSLFESRAQQYAADVETKLEMPMEAAKILAQIFSESENIPVALRRDIFNAHLKKILAGNENFAAVWTSWENNAIDAADSRYANRTVTNESGRFISRWFRKNDSLFLEPVKINSQEEPNLSVELARTTKNDVFTNSYSHLISGVEQIIISAIVPIFIDNTFKGVVGIDIEQKYLQTTIEKMNPYNVGYTFLLDNNLTIVAHKDTSYCQKLFTQFVTPELVDSVESAVKNKTGFHCDLYSQYLAQQSNYQSAPIQVGNATNYWALVITVPEKIIEANTNKIIISSLIAAIISLLILWIIARFAGKEIESNILKIRTEIKKYIDAGIQGNLSFRASYKQVHPDFQPMIIGFNEMLDTIIKPVNQTAHYIEQVSKGIIPEQITDNYEGEFKTLKNNLNAMTGVLTSLTREMNNMYKQQAAGDIDYYIDDTQFKGVYQQVAQGYNQVVKLHVDNILAILDIVGQFGEGNFTNKLPDFPGKQIIATQIVNQVRQNLLNIIEAMNKMYAEQAAGDIDYFIDIEQFKGEYKNVGIAYNKAVKLHIDAILVMLKTVGEYGQGNFSSVMPTFPGKQIIATTTINQVRENLLNVTNEIKNLYDHVQNGRISKKADPTKHHGEYSNIVSIFNNTLAAILIPLENLIKDIASISLAIKKGDLEKRINCDNMKISEFAIVSKSINAAFNTLIIPLKTSTDFISRIASGEIPDTITEEYYGDFNKIKDSLNMLIKTNKALIETISEFLEKVKAG